MNLYKTIVVEDEGPARRRLEKMVHTHPTLELVASLKSGQEAINQIPKLQPDLLLLDIQLKDKTAFEVLDQLEHSINSKIIFITAYDKYAIKAFEVEAIDYLLKPYDETRFDSAIQRVIKNDKKVLNKEIISLLEESLLNTTKTLMIPEGNKNHIFQEDDITFIESDRYYVEVNTLMGKSVIRITLKSLESILPKKFLRINKSIIINTDFVSQIDHKKQSSKIKLKTNKEFFSSKSYNSNLKKVFPKL